MAAESVGECAHCGADCYDADWQAALREWQRAYGEEPNDPELALSFLHCASCREELFGPGSAAYMAEVEAAGQERLF